MIAGKGIKRICGVVLAAGYGTRIKPITNKIPKPLIPVLGKPLLEILLGKLSRSGADSLHVNIHHLAESFLNRDFSAGIRPEFHHEEEILDTGGGIGNMRGDLEKHDLILLHNGDTISNIEYGPAIDFHLKNRALFTMILAGKSQTGTEEENRTLPPPSVYVSDSGEVRRIGGTAPDGTAGMGYTGMAVISPEALEFFPPGRKAGLVEVLRKMMHNSDSTVMGYCAGSEAGKPVWAEIGTPEDYLALHRRIMIDRVRFDPELAPPLLPLHTGRGAEIAPDTRWKGFLEVGDRAIIGKGSVLENCVVFPETVVEKETEAEYSIFFPGGRIKAGQS